MPDPLGPPAAREERGPVTPAAVLDAALTLFADRGYHGTSVQQIARLLQIRPPSLYNHMSSKQQLLQDILTKTTREVWEDFTIATSGIDDVEARLAAAVRIYALRHATHRREALVVNRDISSLEEPARSEVLELRRRHEHAVRSLIEEGIEAGVFMEQPPSLASFAVLESCVSIARWFQPSGRFSPGEIAEHYSRYALRIARG